MLIRSSDNGLNAHDLATSYKEVIVCRAPPFQAYTAVPVRMRFSVEAATGLPGQFTATQIVGTQIDLGNEHAGMGRVVHSNFSDSPHNPRRRRRRFRL